MNGGEQCATCDKLAGVVLVEDAEKKKGEHAVVSSVRSDPIVWVTDSSTCTWIHTYIYIHTSKRNERAQRARSWWRSAGSAVRRAGRQSRWVGWEHTNPRTESAYACLHLPSSTPNPQPHTHPTSIQTIANMKNQYARAVVECDEFFLKFLEPFKKLKASDEAAAWEKAGTLQFKVCVCVCVYICGMSRWVSEYRFGLTDDNSLFPPPPNSLQIKANVRPNLLLFAPGEDDEPAETVRYVGVQQGGGRGPEKMSCLSVGRSVDYSSLNSNRSPRVRTHTHTQRGVVDDRVHPRVPPREHPPGLRLGRRGGQAEEGEGGGGGQARGAVERLWGVWVWVSDDRI